MTRAIVTLVGAGIMVTGFVFQDTTHNLYNYIGLAGFVLVALAIAQRQLRHK